jgi:hypothetical protein
VSGREKLAWLLGILGLVIVVLMTGCGRPENLATLSAPMDIRLDPSVDAVLVVLLDGPDGATGSEVMYYTGTQEAGWTVVGYRRQPPAIATSPPWVFVGTPGQAHYCTIPAEPAEVITFNDPACASGSLVIPSGAQ